MVKLLASSLPVPNVQALAANYGNSGKIPDKYIRPEAEIDPVVSKFDADQLPVIDFNRLLDPQTSEEELAKLGFACHEWGFFQLINHGVATELLDKMKDDVKEFFKLSLKEKEAYAQLPNSIEGYGQIFVASEDQKLDWGDLIFLSARPVEERNMRFWPTHPPTFRDTLDKYSFAVKEVANCLFMLMAKNLGVDPEIISSMFKDQTQRVRINYYPPCPMANKVLGLSPHTDATGLTLLLQASDVQGLQIKKNDTWFPVDPLRDAFVVNIGDILEILSNGRYRSIEHRATINPEKERLSIAAFHSSHRDITVGPLPELLKEGEEQRYKNMSFEAYMKAYLSAKLDGRSLLDSVKLAK